MAQEPAALPLERYSGDSKVKLSIHSFLTREEGPEGRLSTIVSRAALSIAVLILASAVGLFVLREVYADRVYPSVFVAGADIGGMSRSEAEAAIQARSAEIQSTRVTFNYEGVTWNPTFAEIGLEVDAATSVNDAFLVGREDDARHRVSSTLRLSQAPHSVPLTLTLNSEAFASWLDSLDSDLGRPAQDARLVVENGIVSVVPDRDGIVVDRTALRKIIYASMGSLTGYQGPLPVVPQPAAIHAADLAPAKARLDSALAVPIEITHGKSKQWTLGANDLGQFVVQIEHDSLTGTTIEVTLDRDKLASYLKDLLSDEVNKDPRNAEIAWNFEKQKVFAVEKSASGARLKPKTLADAVIAGFFGGEKTIKVPVTKIKPDIDSSNLEALGITTRIGVGDSNFEGSDEGRSTNIWVGASLLNGTVVPPGGEYSFNHSIGEITADKGYVESLVVDGERINRDIGGGICQVSTTVFRAAFFAGLPVTEWHPHRYRLGFYEQDGWPPGLDASILQPEGDPFGGGDFKFENPTDSWLLIESYVDGPRVYVIIYGPELGYDVKVSDAWYGEEVPPAEDLEVVDAELAPGTIMQTEYPTAGMDVFYQRTVYNKNGELLWDRTFGTHFYARGNVYKVSPDMAGQSPAA